jgi:hypothetical protein
MFPPPTARFQLVTTAIGAEAVAFLGFVRVKTMLPGVAVTVRELATVKVIATAAALLAVCACNGVTDTRFIVSAPIIKVTFLKNVKVKAP